MKAPVKPKPKKAAKVVCTRVRVKGTKRVKRVCKPVRKKPAKKQSVAKKPVNSPIVAPAVAPPAAGGPIQRPSPAAPPVTTPPQPGPAPPIDPPNASGLPVYSGTFGVREAQRLLWRAGFGPRPGDAEALAEKGVLAAVRSLTQPAGAETFSGAPVTLSDGTPFAPYDAWGHDHLWFLDRMVRSDQPLVQRMTLILHDWFATSNADVNQVRLMLDQNDLLRTHALGSFTDLLTDLTIDPAMLIFLSGISNRRNAINENYAREVMELFTLGADRGAYTETDVRQLARALSGWRADWQDDVGFVNFRFDPARADTTTKTLWAGHGICAQRRVRLARRLHARAREPLPPLVLRPEAVVVLRAERAVRRDAGGARGALRLQRPLDRAGRRGDPAAPRPLPRRAPLVKPPAVFTAGLLRATGQTIATDDWVWLGDISGQRLFYPPNVSGWNDRAWLDTSRLYGRWYSSATALYAATRLPQHYTGSTETGAQALSAALDHVGGPALTPESTAVLQALADQPAPLGFDQATYRAHRQNMLRQLIATSPDYQVC